MQLALSQLDDEIIKQDGKIIHLWGSQDVVVMKLIANHLSASLPLSNRCTHIKGHGIEADDRRGTEQPE
jgi:hypothetical protein